MSDELEPEDYNLKIGRYLAANVDTPRVWDWHDYVTRLCCHTGCGRRNFEPHAATCPR